MSLKSLTICQNASGKSLHFSLNVLKKPQITLKASVLPKMYLKSLVIIEKPSY
jgi:hypothetical protein